MSGEFTDQVMEFKEGAFSTSFCGLAQETGHMMDILRRVYKQKPYIPPIINCSYGGDDCSQTKCCNDMMCDANMTNCNGYTCYKKDQYFSACRVDPPPTWWDGAVLGHYRPGREIPPAEPGVFVQGTSLFCFSVIAWQAPSPKGFWDSEAQLANNIRQHGLSIFQCDEGDFFNGVITGKAEWGSFSNIDAFVQVWRNVQADGRYAKHDWTVKVDADAVFFPEHLKWHLNKLRTPQGSRVYLRNIQYKFMFMGSLEIMTKEALELYFEKGASCLRGDHLGGEDWYMRSCLDAIGVDHQTDTTLLRDKYCATCPDRDDACTNKWYVAFHFFKKASSWNWCYNEMQCNGNGLGCPEGISAGWVEAQ
jgi:hypothetical protein